jgi:hypothetical protein
VNSSHLKPSQVRRRPHLGRHHHAFRDDCGGPDAAPCKHYWNHHDSHLFDHASPDLGHRHILHSTLWKRAHVAVVLGFLCHTVLSWGPDVVQYYIYKYTLCIYSCDSFFCSTSVIYKLALFSN